MNPRDLNPPPQEVVEYYRRYPEETRLASGSSRLEFERSKEILRRFLPSPPARVLDVGGAAGVYSSFLADLGYETHLVDLSSRLVEEARARNAGQARPIASFSVADARRLPQSDASADAVLVMGPLYHLPDAEDRVAALREAFRVLAKPGVVAVAAISRYASALDGMARKLSLDPRFLSIRDRDLAEGQHRNDTGDERYFTTAYFHRPEDLRGEIEAAGFQDVAVLGVEGPGWLLADFDARWADDALRRDLLAVARACGVGVFHGGRERPSHGDRPKEVESRRHYRATNVPFKEESMALWFKLFHIAAVIAFLGNITTGVFWHRHAAKTKDAKILAHTMEGIIRSDKYFTNPGAILIVLMGFGAAGMGKYPILHTGWILWTIVLFIISGAVFGMRLVPLQRKMRDCANAGVSSSRFDYAAYEVLGKQWEMWGLVATVAVLLGLALMVLKPF